MDRIPNIADKYWEEAHALYAFSNTFLQDRYDDPKPTPWFHIEWWALFLSDYRQCAVAAPRGHSKSTAITFAYVIFVLGFKKFQHILVLGSNETNASAFLNEIQVEFIENDDLARYLGFKKFKKSTETELIIEWEDGTKSRVLARGTDQKIRGIKWERKRPDLVLFDDMEDEEMVMNQQRREKFRKNFYGAVKPIIKRKGKIRGVGTIIGFGSFLESVMPNEKSDDTVIEPLRVYARSVQPWMSVKYRAHNADMSEILWPEQFSKEDLEAERADYAARGILDIYGQEYLNNPIDEATSYFRKTDLLPMTDDDRDVRKTYYAACDFAIGESDRSKYTVIIVGGIDINGTIHIVDVRRDRMDGMAIVEEMFSVQEAWKPECFRVESENIAKSIGSFLYSEMDRRGTYLSIDDASPTKDKDKRARSIQAKTRARKVKFDKDADWYADFEEEITKYPKHEYNDQFDAFGWLGLMLDDMAQPPTDEDLASYEYQEAYKAAFRSGRNTTTGY